MDLLGNMPDNSHLDDVCGRPLYSNCAGPDGGMADVCGPDGIYDGDVRGDYDAPILDIGDCNTGYTGP